MFEIEITAPRYSTCDCCGGRTVIITRFVFKEDRPFALYHATFSASHPESGVMAAIGFDEDWELVESPTRAAFACHLIQTKDEQGVRIMDWAESPWKDSKVIGRKIGREDSRSHPLLEELFRLTDHIFAEDPTIRDFFREEAVH